MSSIDRIRELLKDPANRKAAVAAARAWRSSTLSWVSNGTRLMAEAFLMIDSELGEIPILRKELVGIHGRNSEDWDNADFNMVKDMGIKVIKMMSHTHLGVFDRLRRENPELTIITRLWDAHLQDTYFNRRTFPSPLEYVVVCGHRISNLKSMCNMFEIHNEPGHPQGYEGWGISDNDAKSFNDWYIEVIDRFRQRYGNVQFGFPGLAVPHNDLNWIRICKPAIDRSDWLGCHTYWQFSNHLHPDWGLRFTRYHDLYPTKDIYLTECGDSSPYLEDSLMATQTVEYYRECSKYPYIKAACFFLMSSPDTTWRQFVWREESGKEKYVIRAVKTLINS